MKYDPEKEWEHALKPYIQSEKYKKLMSTVDVLYQKNTIYPEQENIFRALIETAFEDVSVIILGQDPYHEPGQAHGLAFSVPENVKIPPSLRNIYREVSDDTGVLSSLSGDLSRWAKQGVLLLNSILTVEHNLPGSHKDLGWQDFTDCIIQTLSLQKKSCVFMLWGNYARSKKNLINETEHLILESPHPSPLSAYRGFFGNRHFTKANRYLLKYNKKPITW